MTAPTGRWWIEVRGRSSMFSAEATGATADEALQSWMRGYRFDPDSYRIDEGPTDPAGGVQRTITFTTGNVRSETVILRPIPAE